MTSKANIVVPFIKENSYHLRTENAAILIIGYIRESYIANKCKFNSHSVFLFTQPLNDIIFLYFYTEPTDRWDPNCISSWMEIVDQEETDDSHLNNNSEINEKGPMIVLKRYGPCSAFFTNVVYNGKHEWKFKIEETQFYWWFFIGIWKVDSGEMLFDKWFNSEIADNSYTFAANFECLPNPSIPNNNYWGGYDSRKNYGKKCVSGDIIDMHLDFNDLTLAFSINGKYYGIAYENIERTKYRAVVGLCYQKDSVRLLSYKSS